MSDLMFMISNRSNELFGLGAFLIEGILLARGSTFKNVILEDSQKWGGKTNLTSSLHRSCGSLDPLFNSSIRSAWWWCKNINIDVKDSGVSGFTVEMMSAMRIRVVTSASCSFFRNAAKCLFCLPVSSSSGAAVLSLLYTDMRWHYDRVCLRGVMDER